MAMNSKGRTVWSSEKGGKSLPAACPRCGAHPCRCEPFRSLPPAEQAVRVRREKAGRGGKTVTVAGPFVLVRDEAAALLAAWKRLCGGGGTLKVVTTPDGIGGIGGIGGGAAFELEIQGDHADRILATLVAAGFQAKRSGG
jgi:translation initiation factor 1